MDIYHAEEMASLIGIKWDLQEALRNGNTVEAERIIIRNQLTENAYRLALIIDLYQNRNIRFIFQKNTFTQFSEVVGHPEFDLDLEQALLKRVFELCHITTIEIIDVHSVGKYRDGIYKAVTV